MKEAYQVEGSPVESIIRSLRWLCIYNPDQRSQKMYSWALCCCFVITILFSNYLFWIETEDKDKLVVVVHHCWIFFIQIPILYSANTNHHLFEFIITNINKMYDHRSPMINKYSMEIKSTKLKEMAIIKKIVTSSAAAVVIEIQIFFILETNLWKTYYLFWPSYLPFDDNNLFLYFISLVWQELMIVYTCSFLASFLLYNCIFFNRVLSELRILDFAINNCALAAKELWEIEYGNCPDDEDDQLDSMKQMYISRCYHCAKHHSEIIEYFEKGRETMKISQMMFFLSVLILFICTLLTSVSDNIGIKLKFLGIIVVQLAYLYSINWMSQRIADVSENLMYSISGAEWWRMPKSCHQILRLIITRCMRPLYMSTSTGGFINNESFMNMMKASYSYFNLIFHMKNS